LFNGFCQAFHLKTVPEGRPSVDEAIKTLLKFKLIKFLCLTLAQLQKHRYNTKRMPQFETPTNLARTDGFKQLKSILKPFLAHDARVGRRHIFETLSPLLM